MNDKKNIDRLFQEQLKDFEVNPPEFVWENIREKLEEKKKRRAVPIWFRYSGVAAGLVAGAFFGWQYLNNSNIIDPQKADDAVVLQRVGEEPAKAVDPKKVLGTEDKDAAKQRHTLSGNPSTLVSNDGEDNANVNGGLKNNTNTVETEANKKKAAKTIQNGLPKAGLSNGLARGADSDNARRNLKPNSTKTLPGTNDQIASKNNTSGKNNGITNPKEKHNVSDEINTVPGSFTNGTAVVTSEQKDSAAHRKKADNSIDQSLKDQVNTNTDSAVTDANKSNTESATRLAGNGFSDANDQNAARVNGALPVIDKDVALHNALPGEQKVLAQVTDTVKPVAENELEKLLREKESGKKDTQVAEGNGPKWNVKPQVAPVFYNSFSSGSPIDQQFASNSKNYDKDLSVGVGLNYAVNDRFSIRSGVNTVNLNYATQNIQFYASLEGSTNNVTAKGGNTATARNASIVVTNRTEGFTTNAMVDSYSGSMVQTTGYIEVPLEMSYALLRNKFGIEVIGGVSTLFLNENKVSVVSTQGLSTTVGEADNLNNVHFSTNIGLGFKYRIFKALEANFEPTFKYQVNTYSHDAGNFKPYFIGLYSGVSFSF